MSKDLLDLAFDPTECVKQVKELGELLESKDELSERDDIQPFFKERLHLSAFLGAYAPKMGLPNKIGFEVSLLGDFTADLILGSSNEQIYCLIEFEDARQDSIFKQTGRSTKEWGRRFEHGFGQVVDWFYQLDDFKKTDRYSRLFGSGPITLIGMLIIGRQSHITDADRKRLHWRMDKVLIDSKSVLCLTFDDVQKELAARLAWFDAAARSEPE